MAAQALTRLVQEDASREAPVRYTAYTIIDVDGSLHHLFRTSDYLQTDT